MDKQEIIKLIVSNALTNLLFIGLFSGFIGYVFNKNLSKHKYELDKKLAVEKNSLDARLEPVKTELSSLKSMWDDNRKILFELLKNLYPAFINLETLADNLGYLLDYYCNNFAYYDDDYKDQVNEKRKRAENYFKESGQKLIQFQKVFEKIYYEYNLILNENMLEILSYIIKGLQGLIEDKQLTYILNLSEDYLERIHLDSDYCEYEEVESIYEKHGKLIELINKRNDIWNEIRISASVEGLKEPFEKHQKKPPEQKK